PPPPPAPAPPPPSVGGRVWLCPWGKPQRRVDRAWGPGDKEAGVRLLSIGAFAHATRLPPKALRLYGELGLLPPAFVDPASGYRFYDPAQLERARLVAWLRRLGMPLARIRVVCDLEPGRAADEVAAYWSQVEADTASRRALA